MFFSNCNMKNKLFNRKIFFIDCPNKLFCPRKSFYIFNLALYFDKGYITMYYSDVHLDALFYSFLSYSDICYILISHRLLFFDLD